MSISSQAYCVVYSREGKRRKAPQFTMMGDLNKNAVTIEAPKSIPQNRKQIPNIIISEKAEKIKSTCVKVILVSPTSRAVG